MSAFSDIEFHSAHFAVHGCHHISNTNKDSLVTNAIAVILKRFQSYLRRCTTQVINIIMALIDSPKLDPLSRSICPIFSAWLKTRSQIKSANSSYTE